ncbi:hypothetical protein FRC10_005398 [Ceratobasidium sp. 414]|nr:hypothetical protein FRC10_005398 [Ceratobasidium sp. 414]
MFAPLLPLLMIVARLQGFVFNYYNAAHLTGLTFWSIAAASASEALLGTVALVELQIEGCLVESRLSSLVANIRESVRLEDITVSSLFYSTAVPSLGPYKGAPYLSLLSGGLEPSRPSSAVAPARGFANRLSTSAAPSFPLPTVPAGSTPLGDTLALAPHPTATPLSAETSGSGEVFLSLPPADSDGELLVAGPWTAVDDQAILDPPASEGVRAWSSFVHSAPATQTVATPEPAGATPIPAPPVHLILSPAAGTPDDRPSWASQHALVLVWTLPLAVYLGIGIGLYLARPKDAGTPDIRKTLRVLEELGDLPRMISEYNISPGELRNYIELVVRTREGVDRNPTAEPEVPISVPF